MSLGQLQQSIPWRLRFLYSPQLQDDHVMALVQNVGTPPPLPVAIVGSRITVG